MAAGRVPYDIIHTEREGREGVEATCSDCGHKTFAYGRSDASRKRCLAQMREECPEWERDPNWKNFYVDADESTERRAPIRPADPKPRPWWEK